MAKLAIGNLEPEALARIKEYAERHGYVSEETGQSMVMHSIAISLKRIADVQERMAEHYAK